MRTSIPTAAAVLLTTHLVASPALQAQEDPSLAAELLAVLEGRQELFANNPNAHREVFDKMWVKDENVVMVSEDFHQVFHGRDAVEAYFTPPEDRLYVYREQLSNPRAIRIADGLVSISYDLRYDVQERGQHAIGGVNHMVTVMRQTEDGWKIQAEVQLPMGLISQARVIHELAVSPDFTDFARRQTPGYDELIANDARLQSRRQGVVPWVAGGSTQPTRPDSVRREERPDSIISG